MSTLSVDDLAIGEILIALKRDPVVHETDCATTALAPMVISPSPRLSPSILAAPYRSKVELKVNPPRPDDEASFQPTTVSPVASTLYSIQPRAHSPSERSKRYGPVIELEDLRKCFNMPIATVARQFGICATLLKKICRRHGIQRWPHRQIRSLQKSIDMLRESLAVAKGTNKDYIAKKIAAFEYTLECIMQDPNTAAKGISSGRLASPASEELAKRAKRSKPVVESLASAAALAALTDADDEEEDGEHAMDVDSHEQWETSIPSDESAVDVRKDSMSLRSILC
ncbi:hypothetical protein ATCC90586_008394 [Pythium insidiosum]|nr:hypothetical protein ATCC90586_008394 [Pythium insidiosum]